MKKISITKVKKELENYSVDDTHKEMIINNIQLFNEILKDYQTTGEKKNAYLLYQLNMQIVKQLVEVKKLNQKFDDGTAGDDFLKFKNKFEK